MRSALARSGVASTVAYADRDRKLREMQREEQEVAIWSEHPRPLKEGEVCFRIASPKGYSIGYNIEPANYQNGTMVSAPKIPMIQFVEDPCGHFGEFITSDKAAIARLRRPDCVLRGIVEWDKAHAEGARKAGELAAEKLKDPSFLEGVVAGLRKLGISQDSAFLDALTKPHKAPKEPQPSAGA